MGRASYGVTGIKLEKGKKLNVTTESELGVSDAVALDTNKRFRNFLEKATGYTAKQRLQMAKKEATKGAD